MLWREKAQKDNPWLHVLYGMHKPLKVIGLPPNPQIHNLMFQLCTLFDLILDSFNVSKKLDVSSFLLKRMINTLLKIIWSSSSWTLINCVIYSVESFPNMLIHLTCPALFITTTTCPYYVEASSTRDGIDCIMNQYSEVCMSFQWSQYGEHGLLVAIKKTVHQWIPIQIFWITDATWKQV
jgi:hypothetical protein